MSYNHNFYNNFHGNNSTFQSLPPMYVPPPPQPPPFIIAPTPSWAAEKADQEFLKTYEHKISIRERTQVNRKPISLSKLREEIRNMLTILDNLKNKEKMLADNVSTLSDDEWTSNLREIENNKTLINKILSEINGPYLDMLRKLLAKRSAKRLRLKRVRLEIKKEKEDRKRELAERSRKIDENLQKIKDDIYKAKQEEESKLQADIVLREVLRKKGDAKKCLLKLDALLKLRKARQNTAKGRGESVSETDTSVFTANIEKLKLLWTQKLSSYEKEESELRSKLTLDSEQMDTHISMTAKEVALNVDKWREALFGGTLPQAEFGGDVERFITVRSEWDKFISVEGTSVPMGWVPPSVDNNIT